MHPNIQILTSAANSLGELTNDLVFLGGCATGLLITDPAAPEIRVTRDVDAIAQITTRMEYYQLADQLRACGFHESQEDGAPLCRWENAEIILDVMPTNENILGFSNPWYEGAIQTAEMVSLPTGETIKLVSPAYFLATKLAAFGSQHPALAKPYCAAAAHRPDCINGAAHRLAFYLHSELSQ